MAQALLSYKYSNALDNIETYLKYSGNVRIDNNLFVPYVKPLSTRVWELLYSFFSSAQRERNQQTTEAQAQFLDGCVRQINQTRSVGDIEGFSGYAPLLHESIMCAIFYNISLNIIQDWNRFVTPSFFSPLTNRVSQWLGYRSSTTQLNPIENPRNTPEHLERCSKRSEFFGIPLMVDTQCTLLNLKRLIPNEKFYADMRFYRAGRFNYGWEMYVRGFLKNEFQNFLEAVVQINTLFLAVKWQKMPDVNFNQVIDRLGASCLKKDREQQGQAGFEKAIELAKTIQAYFPGHENAIQEMLVKFITAKAKAKQDAVSLESIFEMMKGVVAFYHYAQGSQAEGILKRSLFSILDAYSRIHANDIGLGPLKAFANEHLQCADLSGTEIWRTLDNPPPPESQLNPEFTGEEFFQNRDKLKSAIIESQDIQRRIGSHSLLVSDSAAAI